MNLSQPTTANVLLASRPLDYAAAGFEWSVGLGCYIRRLGDYGDYWLSAHPPVEPGSAVGVFLTCDERMLLKASVRDNTGLNRAVTKAQRIIRGIYEQAACEDMNELTESLGMGRLFDNQVFA